jgi:hypothetical protein
MRRLGPDRECLAGHQASIGLVRWLQRALVMSATMRAAVFEGANRIGIRAVPRPTTGDAFGAGLGDHAIVTSLRIAIRP